MGVAVNCKEYNGRHIHAGRDYLSWVFRRQFFARRASTLVLATRSSTVPLVLYMYYDVVLASRCPTFFSSVDSDPQTHQTPTLDQTHRNIPHLPVTASPMDRVGRRVSPRRPATPPAVCGRPPPHRRRRPPPSVRDRPRTARKRREAPPPSSPPTPPSTRPSTGTTSRSTGTREGKTWTPRRGPIARSSTSTPSSTRPRYSLGQAAGGRAPPRTRRGWGDRTASRTGATEAEGVTSSLKWTTASTPWRG